MEEEQSNNTIHRNEKGGVLVTKQQIRNAFEFLDVEKTGKITLENLKTRLGVFKGMGIRDFKFLLNNEHEISMDQLEKLLMDNSISDYDPVAEAFKFYDPENTGFINTSVLRSLFENLGFGKLTDDDLRILISAGDVDADGKISLKDFRKMLYDDRSKDSSESE